MVIATWFQGLPASQIDQFFFCASISTACQHRSPAGSERMEEGEQVKVDTGGPGTSALSSDLMCFYSPLLSSRRDRNGYGCPVGFLVNNSIHFGFLFCKIEFKLNRPQVSFSVSLQTLMCKKKNENQFGSYFRSVYSSQL